MASFKPNIILLVILMTLTSCSQQYSSVQHRSQEFVEAAQMYGQFMLPHLQHFRDFLKDIEHNNSISISKACQSTLSLFERGLEEKHLEAMTIFSSYSKGQSGFFTDRITDFGHYKQCLYSTLNGSHTRYVILEVSHPIDGRVEKPRNPTHKYHNLLHFSNFVPFPVLHAVCLPSECSLRDVEILLKDDVVRKRIHPFELDIYGSESLDDIDPFEEYRWHRFIAKSIVYSLAILTFMATFFENLLPEGSFVRAWNAKSNTAHILKDGSVLPDDRLHVFNFYKTLYLISGLMIHIYLAFTFKGLPFMQTIYHFGQESGTAGPSSTASLLVTINFMTSAALAVITIVPIISKITFSQLVLGRALRIIPVIAFITLVQIAFPFFDYNPFGRGPLYLAMHKNMTANCVLNGWADLTFLTSTVPIKERCNLTTWFISNDFCFYLIFSITFVFLAKKPGLGMLMLGIQAILGCILHYKFLKSNKVFPPIPIGFETSETLIRTYEYAQYEIRGYISSYCVGIALGFALLNVKKRDSVSILQVFLSTVALVACSYSFIHMYDLKTQESPLSHEQQLVFASTIRLLFLSSFAWLFYCLLQTSDVLIRFTKRKIFTLGSRFSFSTFMIHPLIITYLQSTSMIVDDFSLLSLVTKFCFVLPVSLLSGYLIMIMVEYPMNILLRKSNKDPKKLR